MPNPTPAHAAPTRQGGPQAAWEHRELYDRVLKALYALPGDFDTDISITGVRVTDLHTFNTALGAAIEQSVVENLNKVRSIWDPDERYKLYRFVRQPQVFPDVRLQTDAPGMEPVLMGIELKGWFALAKEGEPSFRYTVNPDVCAPADLLVVFPWILKEVISGSPVLLRPFVEEARYAAEIRNHYWSHTRGATGVDAQVNPAEYRQPYPRKNDRFNDAAVRDSGKNFGRVSRGGIMSAFIGELMTELVAGVPLSAWQKFIKIFSDGQTDDAITTKLNNLKAELAGVLATRADAEEAFERLTGAIRDLLAPAE